MIKQKKCAVIGDQKVGKSAILVVHFTGDKNSFDKLPNVFRGNSESDNDDLGSLSVRNGSGTEVLFVDTASDSSLANFEMAMMCFAVNDKSSFENVKEKWVPKLKEESPSAILLLVGTKVDLRSDENKDECVSIEEGKKMANEINAFKYMETSAFKGIGINEVIEECTSTLAPVSKSTGGGESSCCTIL